MTHPAKAAGLVWLASYPKSGNTWLRALISAYQSADGVININKMPSGHAAGVKSFERHLGFDGCLLTDDEARIARQMAYLHMARSNAGADLIKVHDANLPLPEGGLLFPPAATAAAVHIVRHPFDVAVSVAYHFGWAPDFGRAVASMCDAAHFIGGSENNQFPQILSDWGTHTLSWLDMPGVNRITLRYEDMLQDTADALTRALRAIYPDQQPDPARILQAVDATRFDRLQAQEADGSFKERPQNMASFFRSGRSGGWREHLTPAHCAMLVEALGAVMDRLGYCPDGSSVAWPAGQ